MFSLPPLLREAALSAAIDDGVHSKSSSDSVVQDPPHSDQASTVVAAAGEGDTPGTSETVVVGKVRAKKGGRSTKTTPSSATLRRGKWSYHEEQYANRIIIEFKAGVLPLADGTTLRTFLSRLLKCDPMRISKKFVGDKCIGRKVYRRRDESELQKLSPKDMEKTRLELCELERLFLDRVFSASSLQSRKNIVQQPKSNTT